MVVTCVAFTRSLPAPASLTERPIEAAATAHFDPRYIAGGRVRTGRLPDVVVDFRGRPVPLTARALHHRRVDRVDLVLEIDDPEAATYLAAFDHTAGAVSAELFRVGDDRCSIASLHASLARDLTGAPGTGPGTTFQRLVFHRGADAPAGAAPGPVPGHRLTVAPDRVDVHADTTVFADERLGYEMVAGLCARSAELVDDLTRTIDALALAAGAPDADVRALLRRAAEVQRWAVVVQRESTVHRVLSPALAPVHRVVDEAAGLGGEGRRDLDRSIASLGRLIDSLLARAIDERIRAWERYGAAALVLLIVMALALVALAIA